MGDLFPQNPPDEARGNITNLSHGMDVLWKGIMKGKAGQESTRYEWFHGIFNGWNSDDTVMVN